MSEVVANDAETEAALTDRVLLEETVTLRGVTCLRFLDVSRSGSVRLLSICRWGRGLDAPQACRVG